MSNHEQLPEGLIIPPMPTEIPEIVNIEAPVIRMAETHLGYDTPASVLSPETIVSQPIPTTEQYQSLDIVGAKEHATSQFVANNARERLASAESAATRTRTLFEKDHDGIVKKIGQHETVAETTLHNELARVDREFALVVAYYERKALAIKREASDRYEQKSDAIAAVNTGNEAALSGFMRTEVNIGSIATYIRAQLNEQEVIRDRSKVGVDQLVAELASKQKERNDKNSIVDELNDQLTNLDEVQDNFIKAEVRLTMNERAAHGNLLVEATEQDVVKEARNNIYNQFTDTDRQKEEDNKYLQELSERLTSKELEAIRYDIQLNNEGKLNNEAEIRHRAKIVVALTHEIKELDKRIKSLPGLIVVEKTKCSDAIEVIDRFSKESARLERAATKLEIVRLHPEISKDELMKLSSEDKGIIDDASARQILGLLEPVLKGGSSLTAALRGEDETSQRLANAVNDFAVESAPELIGFSGEAIPAPDVSILMEAARKAHKETGEDTPNMLSRVWKKIVGMASRPESAYQYDVTNSNQLSITMSKEG